MAYVFTASTVSLDMISDNVFARFAAELIKSVVTKKEFHTVYDGYSYSVVYDAKYYKPKKGSSVLDTGKYLSFFGGSGKDAIFATEVQLPKTKVELLLPISGKITSINTFDYDRSDSLAFTSKTGISQISLKVSTVLKTVESAIKNHNPLKDPDGFIKEVKSLYEDLFKGKDFVYGGDKSDILLGYGGNDILSGGGKADWLFGGDGDDVLTGGTGQDHLYGGDFERMVKKGKELKFTYSDPKGDHSDWADYSGASGKVKISIGSTKNREYTSSDGLKYAKGDLLYGIENLRGSAYDDTLSAEKTGNMANTLAGGAGHDALTGGGGHDVFLFDSSLSDANADTITDFTASDKGKAADKIWFSHGYYYSLGAVPSNAKVGAKFDLKDGDFASGTDRAEHPDALLFYNETDGKLYYDADGAGTSYFDTLVATLNIGGGHPAHLTNANFEIVV